jgi:CheY-like chemotaxis protein
MGGAELKMTSSLVPLNVGRASQSSNILLVEDELFVRMVISDSLREEGFEVIETFNVDEAISILRAGAAIDLILSDVRMPGAMDGLDLLDHTREAYPQVPVIIMSGHLMAHDALDRGPLISLPSPTRSRTRWR